MTVLVLAPHADDETLGMGGTIAKLARQGRRVVVAVVTGHGGGDHPLWEPSFWDTIRSEAAEAVHMLGAELIFENLPAVCVPDLPVHQVNATVAGIIERVAPTELFLPYYHDLHGDHGTIGYAALVAARAYLPVGQNLRLVAMYETPTETHLMPPALAPPFVPNFWVDVGETIDTKLRAWDCYRSQHHSARTPRSAEAIRAQATVRGAEIGAEAAEGFVLLKLTR